MSKTLENIQRLFLWLKTYLILMIILSYFCFITPISFADVSNGFDYPVGKPDGNGWINNRNGLWWLEPWNYGGSCGWVYHPGVDFNKDNTSGDQDRYEPVYAVSNGTVVASGLYSSTWGNIVIIEHTLSDSSKVWSQYAHLEDRWIQIGDIVTKGEQIGKIGKGDGSLSAHLHFEIRKFGHDILSASSFPCGQSKSYVETYYEDPIAYINSHRTLGCNILPGEGTSGSELTAFENAFNNAGGQSSLGCPTNTVQSNGFTSFNGTTGHYQTFTNGSIQYITNGNYAGQAFAIIAPLYSKWSGLSFNSSNPLGYPVGNLSAQSISSFGTSLKYQSFEGGALEYHLSGSHSGSVYEIHGAIYTKWGQRGYADSVLGLPTSDERDANESGATGKTGRVSDFEGGHIHWVTGAAETYETHGAIDNVYVSQYSGSGSWLGFPISDEYADPSTGYQRNDFEGGYITTVDGVNYQAFSYNHNPQLSNGYVNPNSGDTPTNFYYYADYYDEDGDSPSTKLAYIDGTGYTLSLYSGLASNGTYRYGPKTLSTGNHNYYFDFKDGNGGSGRLPNTGLYSGPSVFAPSDTTSPSPDPMTWEVQPSAANSTSILMVATTATDSQSSPVSYLFDFIDSPTGGTGGSDSNWQSSTSYADSELQPNHQYGYRVKARDSASTPNETSYSPTVYEYTHANPPETASFFNISQTGIQANWTANWNRSGTEYYCENMTKGTNSDWTTNTHWDSTGLTCDTSYSFRVKAKNSNGVETSWTNLGSQSTQACSPDPEISQSPISLSNSSRQGENAPSQSFEVWNSGGGTLTYSISDSVSWFSCTPANGTSSGERDTITVNYSTSGLSPGNYSAAITITASDATNSPQTLSVSLTVSEDTAPPNTSITSGPTGTITTNSVSFIYTGSDDITSIGNLIYSTYLQGYDSGWSTYSSGTGISYSGLSNGSYTFQVKVKDESGNEDATPATQSFTVEVPETNPPDTSITSGPSGTIDYRDVTFNWTGSDDITSTSNLVYSYKLDGYDSSWSSYSSSTSKSYYGLSNGSYTFYVKAKDQSGNVDPSPLFRSFKIPLKGDINGDSNVDLTDAIIALKVSAGTDTSGLIRSDYVTSGVDVNGDNKVGIDEIIYILQVISGLREANNPPTDPIYPDTVVDTISVGDVPTCITVTLDGSYIYATNTIDRTVSVIQTSDNAVVDTISVGDDPYGITVTPNGSYVYVANRYNDTVSVIQTSDNTVIDTISVGDGPHNLAITPDGSHVYATNTIDRTVSVIQTSDNVVVDTISVGPVPYGVAVTPNGSHVYVANQGNNTVSVIQTSDNTVVDTISVSGGPLSVAVKSDGSYVYVTSIEDIVSVIQTSDNTVVDTISVGDYPESVAVTPNGSYVYVTNSQDNTVSVIRISDNTVIDTISVGDKPYGVAVAPDGSYVYVANQSDDTISVLGF